MATQRLTFVFTCDVDNRIAQNWQQYPDSLALQLLRELIDRKKAEADKNISAWHYTTTLTPSPYYLAESEPDNA